MKGSVPAPSHFDKDWREWGKRLVDWLGQVEEARVQLPAYTSTGLPSAEQDGQLIYKPDVSKVSVSFGGGWYDFVHGTSTGWTVPTGTGLRAGFTVFASQSIGGPSATEVQMISDHVVLLSKTVKALVEDFNSMGILT